MCAIKMHLYVCVLFLFVSLSYQRSTPEDTSYVAAVVEFQVAADSDANLREYVIFIQDAALQMADIVVFPEMTLTRGTSVPVPINGTLREYPIPALNPDMYDEVLVQISAAARQNQIYVVINVQEILNCTVEDPSETCPEQRVYYFNTNVVFDRNGTVIDRYRKINLFGEYTRTPALTPDLGIFETDFGVTFGHFICFDLMFQVPAIQVVEKYNITDVIFPTMWFSEMPYLTAVEIQQAYAYSLNVNFLGSGANRVQVGSTGSGIYSGKAGALISLMTGLSQSRLLVARVPKVPGEVEGTYPGPIYDYPTVHDDLRLITDPSLPSHVTRLLNPGYEEFVLTDKDVACLFRVNLSERIGETAPYYRAFIQDGVNIYAKRSVGTLGCAVVACKTKEVDSCVYRFNSNEEISEISELEIQMTSYSKHFNTTLNCDDVVYYPLSFQINKFPLNPKNFTYQVNEVRNGLSNEIRNTGNDAREKIVYKLNAAQKELVAFGVWGRVYNRDGKYVFNPTKEDIENSIEIENIIFDAHKKIV